MKLYGETLMRLGELTFGGVVLGAILKTDTSNFVLIFGGIVFCIILIVVGIYVVSSNDKK